MTSQIQCGACGEQLEALRDRLAGLVSDLRFAMAAAQDPENENALRDPDVFYERVAAAIERATK